MTRAHEKKREKHIQKGWPDRAGTNHLERGRSVWKQWKQLQKEKSWNGESFAVKDRGKMEEKDLYISRDIRELTQLCQSGELKDKKHLRFFCHPMQQIVMSTESSGAAGSCDSSELHTSKPQWYACIRSVQIEPCGGALINTSLYFYGKFAKHKSTLEPFVTRSSILTQTTEPHNETSLNHKPTVFSSFHSHLNIETKVEKSI